MARERRDFEVDRLRQRYASKLTTLKQRLMRAEQRIGREEEQFGEQKMQTAISVGATLLGALMGRKVLSSSTAGKSHYGDTAGFAHRSRETGRAAGPGGKKTVEAQIADMEHQLQQEADQVAGAFDPQHEVLQQIAIRPTRQDILLQLFGIVWVPYLLSPDGAQRPFWATLTSSSAVH